MLAGRPVFREGLLEAAALGAKKMNSSRHLASPQRLHPAKEGLGLHHHANPAAERHVVGGAVAVVGVVAEIYES